MSKRPRWMRNHMACPDCGHIYPEPGDLADCTTYDITTNPSDPQPIAIDCPECKSHWTYHDWWDEQYDKWDRTMKEETV